MLTFTRKEGEKIVLYANDPALAEQFGRAQIEIVVKAVNYRGKDRVDLGISAPKEVRVLRGELKAE